MKKIIFWTILLLIFSPATGRSQTIRINNGTQGVLDIGEDDLSVKIGGYYKDNYLRFVAQIRVKYSGQIGNTKSDVEYLIKCQQGSVMLATDPEFTQITPCPDNQTIFSGTIRQTGEDGSVIEIPLEDIITSENNIVKSWLVSYAPALDASDRKAIKGFPKSPKLEVAGKELDKATSAAIFAIKDWRLQYVP